MRRSEREIRDQSHKYWMYDLWNIKKGSVGPDKRVVRVEFQIRREVIKDLGIDTPKNLFEKIDDKYRLKPEVFQARRIKPEKIEKNQ